MSVIAYTVIRPHRGRREIAEDRIRRAGDIYARLNAEVRISNIIAGPLTRCIVIQRRYADFTAASKTFQAAAADDEMKRLMQEGEHDPAGDFVVATDLNRTIHGDTKWDTHPVSHLRIYDLARDKLADALALIPEVEALVGPGDVNVVALTPITGQNMSSLTIAYQFKSVDHWAEQLDAVGTSETFQQIITRAAQYGTIRQSGVLVPM